MVEKKISMRQKYISKNICNSAHVLLVEVIDYFILKTERTENRGVKNIVIMMDKAFFGVSGERFVVN